MARYFSQVIPFVLGISYSSCGDARLASSFHEVGRFHSPNMHADYPAVTHFVVAPESAMRDRSLVLTYGRRTCADDEVCSVFFWSADSSAATGFPMTDRQAEAIVVSYSRNHSTGRDGFQCYNFGSQAEHCARRFAP